MLTGLTVVIILQYIQISNHYTVHLKLMSIIPQLKMQKQNFLFYSIKIIAHFLNKPGR